MALETSTSISAGRARFKRWLRVTLWTIAGMALLVGLLCVWAVYDKVHDAVAEYGTGRALGEISKFVTLHGGDWPSSPADLGNQFPPSSQVVISYGLDSTLLAQDAALLKQAVHHSSNKFRLYPHYERDIQDLQRTLREALDRRSKNLPPLTEEELLNR